MQNKAHLFKSVKVLTSSYNSILLTVQPIPGPNEKKCFLSMACIFWFSSISQIGTIFNDILLSSQNIFLSSLVQTLWYWSALRAWIFLPCSHTYIMTSINMNSPRNMYACAYIPPPLECEIPKGREYWFQLWISPGLRIMLCFFWRGLKTELLK